MTQGKQKGGVLFGSDPDGDPLTFTIVTPPAHGKLTLDTRITTRRPANQPPGGTTAESLVCYTYLADADYVGPVFFEYTVSDGKLESAPSRLTITVVAAE